MKRFFDLTVSLLLLAVFSPVLLGVGIALKRAGSGVFFRQKRPGKNGKLFTMIKFKTMLDLRDDSGNPLPDEQRLTRLGKFLRATSLDELPELINVVLGDMSLVGPRPLLPRYLDRYTARQARRHEVLPGITGLAQVSGRNALSWEEKFDLDVWYVDNRSFVLDLKILWRTFALVVKRQGVSQPGHATMEEFMGGPENKKEDDRR